MELFPLPRSIQGKSFHRLCARFGAVIIVDFYIDDFIFAMFIFMKDGKAVKYNGSEIIGLIHLKLDTCLTSSTPYTGRRQRNMGKGQLVGKIFLP